METVVLKRHRPQIAVVEPTSSPSSKKLMSEGLVNQSSYTQVVFLATITRGRFGTSTPTVLGIFTDLALDTTHRAK